jgi:hypothetical protein
MSQGVQVSTARLERAKQLPVVRLGPRQYKAGSQYVDLNEGDPCHCEDMMLSKYPPLAMCKHVMAALLYEGWNA